MGSLISLLVMSSSIQFTALTFLSICFVIFTPYTKVEESFNLQAIHDFLFIGFPRFHHHIHDCIKNIHTDICNYHPLVSMITKDYLRVDDILALVFPDSEQLDKEYNNNLTSLTTLMSFDGRWDHQDFPGVVYRSFIGSFILALLTWPFTLIPIVAKDKFHYQIISRIILSIFVISGFNSFANSVGKKYGSTTRRSLIVLTLTQFHFIYYDSRTLSNTYAMVLTLFAFSYWIRGKYNKMIVLVAIVVIVFRFELALLFGIIFFVEIFIKKQVTIKNLLVIGLPTGVMALMVTIGFDTFMWGSKHYIWPEGYSMYFNIYLNKSSDWGTSPFHWYFTSAIPRSLLLSIFFVPFATRKCLKNFLIIPLIYVTFYSLLGHKELRFILYIVPLLNTCAANSVAIMVEKFEGSKPCPESWLVNWIYKLLNHPKALSFEEEIAADIERDKLEREEEEIMKRIQLNKLNVQPKQYDSISSASSTSTRTSSATLRNRKQRNGNVESILDEQYSKITAAVLEKHKSVETILKQSKRDNNVDPSPSDAIAALLEEQQHVEQQLSCTFIVIFILMGIHIWCNVGCTVYASLASWNNYPGGDAITFVNHHIKSIDLIQFNSDQESDSRKFKPNEVAIYVSNLAAQTGLTRFLQLNGITYDKSPTLDHVANRTIYLRKGKGFNKHVTHDFSSFKLVYLILEKIDVTFLQLHCVSTKSLSGTSPGTGTSSSTSPSASKKEEDKPKSNPIENVICNFGENAKNCKIMKVINGFNGIDLSLTSKHVVIKTAPMLWIFRCLKL